MMRINDICKVTVLFIMLQQNHRIGMKKKQNKTKTNKQNHKYIL